MKTMKRYAFIFVIIIFGFLSAAASDIISIITFTEINFDEIQRGDLVAFDVDDVLIESEDIVGKHTAKKQVIDLFFDYINDHSLDEAAYHERISIMLRDMKKTVIEPAIIEKIRKLKERGVIVVALTSCRIGRYGVIESYEKMRHEMLSAFGFTWSFEDEVCIFNHLKKEDKKIAPLFFKGIIVVDNYSKGEVLDAFLTWKQLAPTKIFFIDDNKKNLFSVQSECEEKNISFIGYHYLGGRKVPLDEEKMHAQFKHLVKHQVWLSDSTLEVNEQEGVGEESGDQSVSPHYKRRKLDNKLLDKKPDFKVLDTKE